MILNLIPRPPYTERVLQFMNKPFIKVIPANRRHPVEQRPGVEEGGAAVAAIYRSLDTGAPVPLPALE